MPRNYRRRPAASPSHAPQDGREYRRERRKLALDGEALGDGNLGAGLDGAFDTPNGLRGSVGRAELLRVRQNLLPVAFGLIDVVDQTEVERLFKADKLALGHHLDGLVLGQGA